MAIPKLEDLRLSRDKIFVSEAQLAEALAKLRGALDSRYPLPASVDNVFEAEDILSNLLGNPLWKGAAISRKEAVRS